MPTISSRPSVPTPTSMPSAHQIGDIVLFVPAMVHSPLAAVMIGVKAKVMRVAFEEGKVLYDLAVSEGNGNFYEAYPVRCVDSIFIS